MFAPAEGVSVLSPLRMGSECRGNPSAAGQLILLALKDIRVVEGRAWKSPSFRHARQAHLLYSGHMGPVQRTRHANAALPLREDHRGVVR